MTSYSISDALGTTARILPEKGATVISLSRNGQEYLYRDDANLASSERPRCGIPFLFPMFGRLQNGCYSWNGKTYPMEIHGFAHTSSWTVEQSQPNSLTLSLEDSEETRAQYPFAFRAELRFVLEQGTLSIHQTYCNKGSEAMPFNYGFHPYFRVEQLHHAELETTAATHLDYAVGAPQDFGHGFVTPSIPEGAPEFGSAFLDVTGPTSLTIHPENRKITMTHGTDFPTLVLWTQAGKPFLCAEPINGTPNGLNTGNYLTLNPGETRKSTLSIHVE